jgi:hypothetical protein
VILRPLSGYGYWGEFQINKLTQELDQIIRSGND